MINTLTKREVYKITDANKDKVKFAHTIHEGFSVIENYSYREGEDLKSNFRSEFMSIFVVTEGKGSITLNMKDVELKENSLIHVSHNTLVGGVHPENSCFSVSGVRFSTDFIAEIGMPDRISDIFNYFSSKFSPVWQLEPQDTELVIQQIRLLVEYCQKYVTHPFGKEILIHGFWIFLFEVGALGQKYSQMTRMNFSRQESLVIKFSNLAQQQFRQERTVKKYADQLNVSAKYLTEVVKEYSGKNASEIINDLVILEAKFLLSRSQLSIGQIAENLNFSDQSFFGKYFKRQTGVSPKVYRESEF